MIKIKKMNPKVKKMWVKALLSGKYKQGKGALKKSEKEFCCLGVLCDLYNKQTGKGKWVEGDTDTNDGYPFYFITPKNKDGAMLPRAVSKWAGLSHCAPDVIVNQKNNYVASLAEVNDGDLGKRWGFKRIARAIQKQF